MAKGKKERSIASIIPNVATILSICSGLSAVRFALLERWDLAIAAILLAAIFDALDGRLARFFGSVSRFGAELDSLSDFVSFGVSPALVVYLWQLHEINEFGWATVLFFTSCMGLRLARFNTQDIEGTGPVWGPNFFVGVPAPAAATLGLMPLIFEQALGYRPPIFHNAFITIWMVTVGLLMVSRIPTVSLKKITVTPKMMLPTILFFVIFVVGLFSYPWWMLSIWIVLYVSIMPITYLKAKKNIKTLTELDPEASPKIKQKAPK